MGEDEGSGGGGGIVGGTHIEETRLQTTYHIEVKGKEINVKSGNDILNVIHKRKLWFDIVEIKNGFLNISGTITSLCDKRYISVEAVKSGNNIKTVYEAKEVEQEKIERMLKAAMAAPSACNQQPWEFYVVTDKKVIAQLSEASPYAHCAKEAPVVFVPCYRSEGIAPEYFNIDMSAAVENLLLEADTLGLGAVWMGISPDVGRMEAVRKVLNIPAGLYAFAIVPCGYPAEDRVQENRYDVSRIHYIR